MKELMSLPLDGKTLREYEDLCAACEAAGCDGLEMIWGGEPIPEGIPARVRIGYHLAFYPDWLDFWRQDTAALRRKFGGDSVWQGFYGGDTRARLLAFFEEDMDRAQALGAEYVVFHVSDVSIEEGYTYEWLHTDEEVIDAAIAVLNALLKNRAPTFRLLVENQWWPGFTFTKPALTARLLDGISYPKKGIMLDTGHLMNCSHIDEETEGIRYIHEMLDAHGALCEEIYGVHFHQSLSGSYVRENTGALPKRLAADYYTRYAESYSHILQIDRHQPWTDKAARTLIERIAPEYLVHELSAKNRAARERAIAVQRRTLFY